MEHFFEQGEIIQVKPSHFIYIPLPSVSLVWLSTFRGALALEAKYPRDLNSI